MTTDCPQVRRPMLPPLGQGVEPARYVQPFAGPVTYQSACQGVAADQLGELRPSIHTGDALAQTRSTSAPKLNVATPSVGQPTAPGAQVPRPAVSVLLPTQVAELPVHIFAEANFSHGVLSDTNTSFSSPIRSRGSGDEGAEKPVESGRLFRDQCSRSEWTSPLDEEPPGREDRRDSSRPIW